MNWVPYWHVDAFADRVFGGNQAAVMVLESWPEDAVLGAIAAENLFAETAFLVRGAGVGADGGAPWALRWFTPTEEVRLCGHATLASGHVLLSEHGGQAVRFATREAGVLEVRRAGAGYELALPLIVPEPAEPGPAAALLGGPPLEVWRNADGYNLFLYPDEAAVRALRPDLRGLAMLGNDQFICTAPGTATDAVSRVFVPGGGVDEDSVTGSAHAVLTAFWADRLGRDAFTAHQASARGGTLTCRREGERAILGGACVTVVEGRFRLP